MFIFSDIFRPCLSNFVCLIFENCVGRHLQPPLSTPWSQNAYSDKGPVGKGNLPLTSPLFNCLNSRRVFQSFVVLTSFSYFSTIPKVSGTGICCRSDLYSCFIPLLHSPPFIKLFNVHMCAYITSILI